jgi:repressor LexA
MNELSQRQEEILRYVDSFQKKMGRTPTGPEIAERFHFSDHTTAYRHLKKLHAKGFIELIQSGLRKPLGIRLLEPAARLLRPGWALLGSIPAGPLSESQEVVQQIYGLDDILPEIKGNDVLLVVQGDSMIDDGLLPGQYVLIRPDKPARNGDICAVWVEGEGGTLKHVYRHGKHVTLRPANPRYEPKSYPSDRVRIQGVLVAALAVQRFWR